MSKIELIQTEPEHIRQLLEDMRVLNEEDAYRYGVCDFEELLKIYKQSLFVTTAILDGKIVAIWGILGVYLGQAGRPWSLMSPAIEKHPYKVLKYYRQELDKMLQLFPLLIDMVDIKHKKVLRTLKIMGFTFGEPEPFNGGIFIRAERRV